MKTYVIYLLSFLIFISSPFIHAQASLIKDINTSTSIRHNPYGFTEYDGKVFFGATQSSGGSKIWTTDGTEAGTEIFFDQGPRKFIVAGNLLYIEMSSTDSGRELWKSDGTNNGTTLIKDIYPGTLGSSIKFGVAYNDLLLFVADDGTHGDELWVSDGSPAGTFMLKDINPGDNNSNPWQFVELNGEIFFFARSSSNNISLWSTDGTVDGTTLITGIDTVNDYNNSPNNTWLVKSNNKLYFRGIDDVNGGELWQTDGTSDGTFMLKNINTAPLGSNTHSSNPTSLTDVSGTLYFQATTVASVDDFALWKSDGTEGGTVEVTNIWPNSTPFWNRNRNLTSFNGELFFVASDFDTGHELWKTNGTASGTMLVKDINTSSTPGQANTVSGPKQLTVVNNKLYFSTWNGSYELLYESDGTTQGTFTVDDLNSTQNIQEPQNMAAVLGELYFVSDDDGDINSGTVGDALWSTNVNNLSILDNEHRKILFYPNPVKEKLFLKGIDNLYNSKIKIINSIGQDVSGKIVNNNTIDFSHLPNGIYICIIQNENEIFYEKVLKK